jgi:hypothetical protein
VLSASCIAGHFLPRDGSALHTGTRVVSVTATESNVSSIISHQEQRQ